MEREKAASRKSAGRKRTSGPPSARSEADTLYFGETQIPFIEGWVLEVTAYNYTMDHPSVHYMGLKIDSFDKGMLIIHGADYRINKGEHVRLFAPEGFEKPHDEDDNYFIYGVQILGDGDEVKFQATFDRDYDFR